MGKHRIIHFLSKTYLKLGVVCFLCQEERMEEAQEIIFQGIWEELLIGEASTG